MDTFIGFPNKTTPPTEAALKKMLGPAWKTWQTLRTHVLKEYPELIEEWKFPGAKYGWNYRIRNKKRVTIYFIPQSEKFQVAFVFSKSAFDAVMTSEINQSIKDDLSAARPYAEGRGIRLTITGKNELNDVKLLVDIKQNF